jgi:hypothetical protein
MTEPQPLPFGRAMSALGRCFVATGRLLARRSVHLPRRNVGRRLTFADGSSAVVYRETVADRGPVQDSCVLVVCFRLRWVRGFGHTLFRWESLFNTPLFVGFPGFVSKLWLAHDQRGVYRGLYEWDGAGRADAYVRALWWALIVVSEKRSIQYQVLPGQWRDLVLAEPRLLGRPASEWWKPVGLAR